MTQDKIKINKATTTEKPKFTKTRSTRRSKRTTKQTQWDQRSESPWCAPLVISRPLVARIAAVDPAFLYIAECLRPVTGYEPAWDP